MARLTFAASAAIASFFRRRTRTSESSPATREALSASAEPGFGPGWFDSSWDLQAGLDVREGLPEEARLEAWLDGFHSRSQTPRAEMAA